MPGCDWAGCGYLWIVERVLELLDAAIMCPVSADRYSVDQRSLACNQEAQDGFAYRGWKFGLDV